LEEVGRVGKGFELQGWHRAGHFKALGRFNSRVTLLCRTLSRSPASALCISQSPSSIALLFFCSSAAPIFA